MLTHDCNVRNMCLTNNKHISSRFHCKKSLYYKYYGTKKLQEKFLYELELAKLY